VTKLAVATGPRGARFGWLVVLPLLVSCGDSPPSEPLRGAIFGKVTLEGEPLPGALVTLANSVEVTYSQRTDSMGEYRFGELPLGAHQVRVSGVDASITFVDQVRNVQLLAVGQVAAEVNFHGVYVGSSSQDKEALEALYRTARGGAWNRSAHWLSNRPIGQWEGVTTNSAGRVTHLILVANNLRGSLPAALRSLQSLEHVDFAGNDLAGSIPSELGELTALERLSLRGNALSGAFPEEFADLKALVHLDLAANELSGPLPAGIGEMSALQVIQLGGNGFSGSIPPALGSISSLRHVDLSGNEFGGVVPAALGGLYRLETLKLSNNRLGGPLPAELGRLHSLESLNLSQNRITGTVPFTLGQLQGLRSLHLGNNLLTGELPPELGRLRFLTQLDLSGNDLEGPLPPSFGGLATLETLRLEENGFSGPLPDSIGRARALVTLDLRENSFSGSLPATLGDLDALRFLKLSDNGFTGELPVELGHMESLERLDLKDNRLDGPLPVALALAPHLKEIDLTGNPVSGALPPEYGEMAKLTALHLGGTELRGLLPVALIGLGLEEFSFFDTGLCPPPHRSFEEWLRQVTYLAENLCEPGFRDELALIDLFESTKGRNWSEGQGSDSDPGDWEGVELNAEGRVVALELRDEELSGELPLSLTALDALERIDMGRNRLTGRIPREFVALEELEVLRLDGNPLHGPLPAEMSRLSPAVFDFSNTELCAPPDDDFQEWLGGITESAGSTCELPAEVKLDIPLVYVTQGVQRAGGDVPLIAGSNSLLRVFLTGDPVSFHSPVVEASLHRNGVEFHTVRMWRDGPPLEPEIDEGRWKASYNARIHGELLQPGTGLVVRVDPDGEVPLAPGSVSVYPAEGAIDLGVVTLPALELTVVPVMRSGWDDSGVLDWTRGLNRDSPQIALLRKTLPVGSLVIGVREPYVTTADLGTFTGWGEFLREIGLLRAAEGSKGYYYGAVRKNTGSFIRGFAFRGLPVAVGLIDDAVMTHEIGHSMNLGHAPCGGANSPDPDFPHAGGRIGVWGTDFENERLIAPTFGRDIMGYCFGEDRSWLSDYHFEKALAYRLEQETSSAAVARGTVPDATVPSLVVWGTAEGPDGASLDPALLMDLPARTAAAGGSLSFSAGVGSGEHRAYAVTGLDPRGGVLFRHELELMPDAYGGKHFIAVLPLEAGWAGALTALRLEGPSGSVTMEGREGPALAAIRDGAGRLTAIVRDWSGDLPAGMEVGSDSGVRVSVSRGIPRPEEQVSALLGLGR